MSDLYGLTLIYTARPGVMLVKGGFFYGGSFFFPSEVTRGHPGFTDDFTDPVSTVNAP